MLLSQFILPSLLSLHPSVSTCPLFTSASLLLLCKWVHLYHFSRFHIYASRRGHKIAGRNISNLRYTDDTTLMAESEEEIRSLLMKVKEKSEKSWFKTQHSKKDHGLWSYHFTANRWGKVETVRFHILGLQNQWGW